MIQRFDEQGQPTPDGLYVLYTEHEAILKSVLDREAEAYARHDARTAELEEAAASGLRNSQVADYLAQVPTAPRILRLPVIRHIRAAWYGARIEHHYAFYLSLGQLPAHAHLDYAVVEAIRRGDK